MSLRSQSVEGNTAAIDSGKNLMIYFQLYVSWLIAAASLQAAMLAGNAGRCAELD